MWTNVKILKTINKEIETKKSQNSKLDTTCAKNEESDTLKILMNVIELLDNKEAIANISNHSIASTLKSKLQIIFDWTI